MDLDFNQQGNSAQGPLPVPPKGDMGIKPSPSTPIGANPQPVNNPTPSIAKPMDSKPMPKIESPMPVLDKPVEPLPTSTLQTPPANEKTKQIKKQGHSMARWLTIIILIIVILIVAVGAWMISSTQDTTSEMTSIDTIPSLDDTTSDISTPTDTTESTTSVTTETPVARDTERKADLANIQSYLDNYFNENESYPVADQVTKINNTDSVLLSALVPKFANQLPEDPLASEYWYGYKSVDGKTYELTARLESTDDPSGVLEGSVYIYRITSTK